MIPTKFYAAGAALLLALAIIGGALYGAYSHGVTTTETFWKAENAKALATAEGAARQRETDLRKQIERISNEARTENESLRAAAARADAAATGLRAEARRVASAACTKSATAIGSQAAAAPSMVLADVLGWADETAGELAAALDQARAAGLRCERAYQAVSE